MRCPRTFRAITATPFSRLRASHIEKPAEGHSTGLTGIMTRIHGQSRNGPRQEVGIVCVP